jgi:hypothetical protein
MTRLPTPMWLYRHHTLSDFIDLDHDTGRWRPVLCSEHVPPSRDLPDLPVRSSYTIEDGRRFFCYWTDDQRYFFRAGDGTAIELCRAMADGHLVCDEGLRCCIEPQRDIAGRRRPGRSIVRLIDAHGSILYQLSYDSSLYLRLYGMDFTAASMVQDLSDWDFFVSLKGAIELFTEVSREHAFRSTGD